MAPETHLYHRLELLRLPFKKYSFLRKYLLNIWETSTNLPGEVTVFIIQKICDGIPPKKQKECQLCWTSSSWSSSKWWGATQLKEKDASCAGLLTKCTTRTETNKGSRCQERSSLIVKSRSKRISGLLSKISWLNQNKAYLCLAAGKIFSVILFFCNQELFTHFR